MLLVNHDGSTMTIRHHEPRAIITLPLDYSMMTKEQQMALEKRQQTVHEFKADNVQFDSDVYVELVKKLKQA